MQSCSRIAAIRDLDFVGESRNIRFSLAALLLFIVIPINWVGAIFSGGFLDPYGYRYFMFPIALMLLLFIVHLDDKLIAQHRLAGNLLVSLFGVGLAATTVIVAQSYIDPNGIDGLRRIRSSGMELGTTSPRHYERAGSGNLNIGISGVSA